MRRYELSPAAVQDLEDIEASVAAERPTAAEGVLGAIEAACRLVAEYPDVGRQRNEIHDGVMSFPVGSYIIFYFLDGDAPGIARILHGSRDLPTAFRDS